MGLLSFFVLFQTQVTACLHVQCQASGSDYTDMRTSSQQFTLHRALPYTGDVAQHGVFWFAGHMPSVVLSPVKFFVQTTSHTRHHCFVG